MIGLEGIDQVHALRQHFAGHSPKQREHSNVPRIHAGHGGEQHDHHDKRGRRNSKQPQHRTGVGINHPAMRFIEYRHREFLPAGDCTAKPRAR